MNTCTALKVSISDILLPEVELQGSMHYRVNIELFNIEPLSGGIKSWNVIEWHLLRGICSMSITGTGPAAKCHCRYAELS